MFDETTVHKAILDVASKHHPSIATAVAGHGPINIHSRKDDSILEFLAKTVIGQQLSSRAASTIWGRVCSLGEDLGEPLESILRPRYSARLLECGVSRAKSRALIEMTQAYAAVLCPW